MTIISDEEIEKAAKRRASRQGSTGSDELNRAVERYITIGFEDGAKWALEQVKAKWPTCKESVAGRKECFDDDPVEETWDACLRWIRERLGV